MIEIANSHAGKTTYIIGHYFINGCQTRPLAEFDEVCDAFEVSNAHRQQVKNALSDPDSIWGDDEDWEACAKHKSWLVRAAVARQGFCLDSLVNDKDIGVRRVLAAKGYCLEQLVNDEDSSVRSIVASRGYGLEKLIDDENEYVRKSVAERGFGLDKLINDISWVVRITLARQGYGLDKLIHDGDEDVQAAAKEAMQKVA